MLKFWFYYVLLKIINIPMHACFRMYLKTYKRFWYDSYYKIDCKLWRKIFNKCADELNVEPKYIMNN